MQSIAKEEGGAALVTVLLFMILTFILMSAMLATSGNEMVIAGLHRDGVWALELAQAGIQEARVRIGEGRPFSAGFTSSLNPGVTVTVVRREIGQLAAFQEVQVTATAGRATRRLSAAVLQNADTFPPNITLADNVSANGNGIISSGDAYARTFFQYQKTPTPDLTYAGWWIMKTGTGPIPKCFTHADCVANGQSNWYPATRRAEDKHSALGDDIEKQTKKCPAGGDGPLPSGNFTGIVANDPTMNPNTTLPLYGFDTDGGLAVTSKLPCGLPYEYARQTVTDPTTGTPVDIYFKTVGLDQWFDLYWTFDTGRLGFVKTANLVNHPEFGAIPSFPRMDELMDNYDILMSGGGTINSGNFGCKAPEMTGCAVSTPELTILKGGDYTLAGTSGGFGTMIVNGSLTINGSFTYYGTLIVNGTFTNASGSALMVGGLLSQNSLILAGNFTVQGGGTTPSLPVGESDADERGNQPAWWER